MNTFLSRPLLGGLRHFTLAVGLAVVGIFHTTTAKSAELQVVADIAPVHSLVSMVLGDNNDITLLVPASASPHTFNLKPSQRRALDNAQLIVILSQNFTPSLGRHLKSTSKTASILALSTVAHRQPVNQQSQEPVDENATSNQQFEYAEHSDPHAWLNPINAIDWLDKIATALSDIDATNAERYKHNAQLAKQQLSTLHESINQTLMQVRAEPYIVYHDAYRHFAKSYSLQVPIAIAISDARAPGAGTLNAVRQHASNATCAFSELQYDASIIDTVVARMPIRRGILDPMGSSLEMGKSLYPNLMRSMAKSFLDCLG